LLDFTLHDVVATEANFTLSVLAKVLHVWNVGEFDLVPWLGRSDAAIFFLIVDKGRTSSATNVFCLTENYFINVVYRIFDFFLILLLKDLKYFRTFKISYP